MSMKKRINTICLNDSKSDRFKELELFFISTFERKPEFFVTAPGRVNIIGEHIDYCGYAVFPMAIKQDILIAVSPRDDSRLSIVNSDSRYERFECDIADFKIEEINHSWYKYILCGVKGFIENEHFNQSMKGVSLAIKGTIPPSVGLSSSSALVCAAVLALSHLHETKFNFHFLAELCAKSERFIGTQGGGMDQAASFLSNAGSAQLIEFNPLRCTPVSLPEGATFVVANSLVEINKAAGSEYNTRVVECRLACQLLAKKSNVNLKKNCPLGELQAILGKSFSGMVSLVKELLHPQPYTKTEVCQLLNVSCGYLDKEILSENTLHLNEFQLYKRALHVFTEASRVWEFKTICNKLSSLSDPTQEDTNKALKLLGRIMEESHSSTQFLYECSHPQMDKIVAYSKEIAYGARLTGAGWGGCVIALVDKSRVNDYMALLKEKYYDSEGLAIQDWSSVLFSTGPSHGACIYEWNCNGTE